MNVLPAARAGHPLTSSGAAGSTASRAPSSASRSRPTGLSAGRWDRPACFTRTINASTSTTARFEFHVYSPAIPPKDVVYGDEHILKSENLPSVSEVVDARNHDADVRRELPRPVRQVDDSSESRAGRRRVRQGDDRERARRRDPASPASRRRSRPRPTLSSARPRARRPARSRKARKARPSTRASALGSPRPASAPTARSRSRQTGTSSFPRSRPAQALRRAKFVGGHNGVLGFARRPAGCGDGRLRRATCILPTRSAGARSRRPAREAVARLRDFSAPLRYKGKFEGRIIKFELHGGRLLSCRSVRRLRRSCCSFSPLASGRRRVRARPASCAATMR